MNWVIMSEIDESEAFSYVQTLKNRIILIFIILIAAIIIVAVYFSNTITRPLKILIRYSDELSKQDFSGDNRILTEQSLDSILERGDEVGGLAKSFKHMESELYASVENLKITTSTKERMESELNIGRDIQMSMLPLIFPAFPDHSEFDVHAILHPAREVGGDFYDFFFVDENRFCFCVGDVSGKGVPSALFMALVKTLIKSRSSNDPSTASIMTHVNDEISEDNPASMFVTVFIVIMNIKTGEVVYTNAGHNPPYIIRKDCSIERVDDRHGPVIGAASGMTYKESRANLYHGDTIFMYTDGVTEAMDENNNLYSEKRLAELLSSRECASMKLVVEMVMQSVEQFQGKAEQFDDITILAVQNNGSTESATPLSQEIIIKNQFPEMEKVIEQFDNFAEKHEIPVEVSRRMKIVFDELLNNIISYAYPDGGEHEIIVKFELFGDRLTIVISDDGIPFNPVSSEAPDTDLALEHREEGGMGIHLVHKMMDKVSYQRRIDRNTITLLKKLK
jgi:sigma-B regulation protein RsbU (phosphoserine phosphatase)